MALTIEQKHCKHCSRQSPIFQFLTEDELEKVNAHRFEILYHPGETIFKQGGPATHVLSFSSGLAKISQEIESNKNFIIGLITPGTFITGPGFYVGNRHHYSVIALEQSSVCAIDTHIFKMVLKNNSIFTEHYLEMVNIAYLSSLQRLAKQVQKQVKGKLADAILYLSDDIYKSTYFKLALSTREIAELSGVSKESTARTIKEFCDDHIIRLNRKEMEIINPGILREISRIG